jgi:hypothetical protein
VLVAPKLGLKTRDSSFEPRNLGRLSFRLGVLQGKQCLRLTVALCVVELEERSSGIGVAAGRVICRA